MTSSVLVTGGAGFIGSALVHRLVRQGHHVRVFDNCQRGRADRLHDVRSDIDFIQGDIRNFNDLFGALDGIDIVHHLAYVNGTKNFYSIPDQVLEIAVKGMTNLVDACKVHEVKELYVASSSETYHEPEEIPTTETTRLIVPDPLNARFSYGGGKILWELMAVHMATKYVDKVVIYRPHNVYGPDMGTEHVIPEFLIRFQALINQYQGRFKHFPINGTGAETRAFIFIDDFVDGIMLLMDKGSNVGIYNVGTSKEISIAALARLIGRIKKVSVEVLPGVAAAGGASRRCPNITKIARLGFNPTISLEAGLKRTARWYESCSFS